MQLFSVLDRAVLLGGGREATLDRGASRTWADVRMAALGTASALVQAGLDKEGSVAVLAANSEEWLDLYFGCWRVGTVVVPLNIRLSPAELLEQMVDADVRLIVADAGFAALAKDLQAARRCSLWFIGDGAAPAGFVHLADARAGLRPAAEAPLDGEQPAGVFYTGGSTGRPKGVVLSHRSLMCSALAALATTGDVEGAPLLHTAPLFHLSGAASLIMGTLRGGRHVFLPKFEAGETLRMVTEHRPSSLTLAPAMLQMLLDDPGFASADLSSLKTVVYGSAPMPEPLLRRAIAALPPTVGFRQGYGMTEAAGAVSFLAPADHDPDGPHPERLRSAGRPTMVAEIRILDEAGAPAAPGAVGEVVVRTPTLMSGYLNQPELTRSVMAGGWYRTGDAGRFDEDGYLYIVDRLKDMIVTGGENVYSAEVEAALASHPAVAQAAVFAVPDERWGERVHAEVVVRGGSEVSEPDLVAHCRARIAGYKTPRSMVLRTEPLPVTAAGKVQKQLLKAPYWEGREKNVN